MSQVRRETPVLTLNSACQARRGPCLLVPRAPTAGTTRYFDDPERPQVATGADTGLKCDRSGPVPIILVRRSHRAQTVQAAGARHR